MNYKTRAFLKLEPSKNIKSCGQQNLKKLLLIPTIVPLAKEDLTLNVWAIRFCSAIGFFPYDVDNCKVRMSTKIWKRWLHNLHLTIGFLHTLVVIYRTWETIERGGSNVIKHIVCSLGCCGVSFLTAWIHYCMFYVAPGYYVRNINQILEFFPEGAGIRNRILLMVKRSRQDLLFIFAPPAFVSAALLHTLIFVVLPDGPNFLYYNVPDAWRGPGSKVLCGMFEFYYLSLAMSTVLVAAFFLLGSFFIIFEKMRDEDHGITVENFGTLLQRLRSSRQVQLQVQEFNLFNKNLLLGTKVGIMAMTVLLGFASIKMLNEDAMLALIFLGIGLIGAIAYMVLFEKGFEIPLKMEQYNCKTEELAMGSLRGREKEWILKGLKGVRYLGIQVGTFSCMEKMSALLFVEFCGAQIMDLLLTF